MRIVIDLQGAQTESRFRGIGRYSLSIAQAIARNKGEHEIIIALSSLFPDTIDDIRAAFEGLLPQENIRVWHAPGPVRECESGNEWRREVSEVLREAFLASLHPDVILLTSLFEGFVDDAITSIGKFDTTTKIAVILYDLIPYIHQDKYLLHNSQYSEYYLNKIEHFKKADLLLGISESSSKEAVDYLHFAENSVINISSAVSDIFKSKVLIPEEKQLLKSKYNITKKMLTYAPGGFDVRKNFENLIQAFAALPQHLRAEYQLVIVSKVDDGNKSNLYNIAKKAGLAEHDMIITGYVSDDELIAFYSICELFVFASTHEGFGLPVLEAMNCGAAVIGSNATSIPEVIGLEEALFDPHSVESMTKKIQHALEDEDFRKRLKAHSLIQAEKFSWDESAKIAIGVMEKIEEVKNDKNMLTHNDLYLPLATIYNKYQLNDDSYLLHLSKMIDLNQTVDEKPTLWIDITQLRMVDYGTGIQRVVRAIVSEIYGNLPAAYCVCLVYLEHNIGLWQYHRAFDFEAKYFNGDPSKKNCIIEPNIGDIFLGLDLISKIIDAENQSLLSNWKNRGVKIVFLIYDILPIIHPEWWPDGGDAIHSRWLTTITKVSDQLISISKAVSDDVEAWVKKNHLSRPLQYNYFHLGANIDNSMPSFGLPENAQIILEHLKSKLTFLSVGTVEPRKGHKQTLLAFEKLWAQGTDVNFVIVGKLGWSMDYFAAKVKNHPELNKRLFWLEGISDEYLEKVYAASTCLIAASEGEGFGLPLIEAAQHKLSIIARDIPVFREVAGEYAYYFPNDNNPSVLANIIETWLELHKTNNHPKSDDMPWLTWEESSKKLLKCIFDREEKNHE